MSGMLLSQGFFVDDDDQDPDEDATASGSALDTFLAAATSSQWVTLEFGWLHSLTVFFQDRLRDRIY